MRAPQGISFSRLGCAPREGQAMRPIAGALSLNLARVRMRSACHPRYLKRSTSRGRVRGQEYGQTTSKARNLLQLLMNQKSLSP